MTRLTGVAAIIEQRVAITVSLVIWGANADHLVTFPAHNEVCDRCEGRGKHVNPAIDGNGLSPNDPDLDDDFWDTYWSGGYDVACYSCNGNRVVPVVNPDTLKPWKKRQYALYQRQQDDRRATEREHAAERAMGA